MTTTTETKLRQAAEEVLRNHDGNVARAAPVLARELASDAKRPLLVALAADYLGRFALPASAGIAPEEPTAASPEKIETEPTSETEEEAPDLRTAESEEPEVASASAAQRRRGSGRRRTGMPTASQRAAMIEAPAVALAEIFQRRIRHYGPLGDLRIHELRTVAKSMATFAADALQSSYEDAVDAIMINRLDNYCVAVDPSSKVKDTIPGRVVAEAFADAKVNALTVIRDSSTKIFDDLISASRRPLSETETTTKGK
jgi:hypothetical protein